MGVPTSEVGYTSAMPRREDHEVRKGHWIKKILQLKLFLSLSSSSSSIILINNTEPKPVSGPSAVCGGSLDGIGDSNEAGGMDDCSM